MKDLLGRDIEPGQPIAFATRVGDHAVLKTATVQALLPGDPSEYGQKREDRLRVLVEGSERPSMINLRSGYMGAKVLVLS